MNAVHLLGAGPTLTPGRKKEAEPLCPQRALLFAVPRVSCLHRENDLWMHVQWVHGPTQ